MDQLRPELDNVLQSLSSNGYSVFSLIDDILARCNWEDKRIKTLREGMERDAADICARLLCHVTSGPERVMKFGRIQFKNHRHDAVPIDILPDNVFLEIFGFCIEGPFECLSRHTTNWRALAHVCQRWRGIIFASPRRLDLHLICTYEVPVRENLVFWPVTLPLVVEYPRLFSFGTSPSRPLDEDNIVAALEHPGRVRRIHIHATAPMINKVVTTSFPVLTDLELECSDSVSPVISRGFLGESNIPLLQRLSLSRISFPQFPTPFSSALNLVSLHIDVMPGNGYTSPDAMVRGVVVLTKLKSLSISFNKEMPPSDRHPHPQMRTIFPALTRLNYEGRSEYLEDFLAQIDAPRVDSVMIHYLIHQIQASQLSRFIDRTGGLKIDQFTRANVYFYDDAFFRLKRPHEASESALHLKIIGEAPFGDQVPEMAHLLGQLATTFSKVDDLLVLGVNVVEPGGMDITEWLPLFRLFPAVETLRLSGELAVAVTSALEDTPEEIVTDVFPALRLIRVVECNWNKGLDEDDWMYRVGSMERFLFLRRLFGFPVIVINPGDELAEVEQMW